MRVVSLTPTGIDILDAIGGLDLLVGQSGTPPECPDSNPLNVRQLDPDVILLASNPESENPADKHAFEGLCPDAKILTLAPSSIEEVLDDLVRVGEAVGLESAAATAMVGLRARYWDARNHVNAFIDGPTVAVLCCIEPLRLAGRWIPGMVTAAGGQPIGPCPGEPTTTMTASELIMAAPDRIIVMPIGTDPTTSREQARHLRAMPWWHNLPAAQSDSVAVLDELVALNRPGPELISGFEWLVTWINNPVVRDQT